MARYPNFDPTARPYNGCGGRRVQPRSGPRAGPIRPAASSTPCTRAHWGGYHYRITGKNAKGEVTYEGGWQNNRQMGMHPQHRFVENIFEELDAPGEWFHNAHDRHAVLLPARRTSTSARRPSRSSGCGTWSSSRAAGRSRSAPSRCGASSSATRPARSWTSKEPLLRSDWTIYRGGAVLFHGAEDCTVADCEFDQLGGNAVFVNNYNRRDPHAPAATSTTPGPARSRSSATRRRCAIRCSSTASGRATPTSTRRPGRRPTNYPADCLVEDCLHPARRRGREAGHRRADLDGAGHHRSGTARSTKPRGPASTSAKAPSAAT